MFSVFGYMCSRRATHVSFQRYSLCMSRKGTGGRGVVLVGVLKDRRDLAILRKKRWYRMPLSSAPRRKFQYLAFYQPAAFGRSGKCIRYWARVKGKRTVLRRELLPRERGHERAGEVYYRIDIGELRKLAPPVRNRRFPARRISFGFTTLRRLLLSRNILELYGVSATEEIVAAALRRAKIPAAAQKYVAGISRGVRKRYFLDFAIECARGRIAIECDNDKAHGIAPQRAKDESKDKFLRASGWTVIRLTEKQMVHRLPQCMARVARAVARLGGLQSR